jgi:hypothetical protein
MQPASIICTKTPPLGKSEGGIEDFSTSIPESARHLTGYRFGTKKIAHVFCRVCVDLLARGAWEGEGWSGEFVAVNLACLDGVGDEVLAGLEIVCRNGRWGERPGVVGHL